jgi:glutamate carboxypeptidase
MTLGARMNTAYVGASAVVAMAAWAVATPVAAQQLTETERRIVQRVEAGAPQMIDLLERTVNINSGTLNHAGVRRVADVYEAELRALGFATRWMPLTEIGRSGHLIAERRGTRGQRLLLLGHMDTVFEEDSPFQRFELLNDSVARGPGVADMKGGNAVLIAALRALHEAGALDGTHLTLVLTGDEERPGRPLEVARAAMVEAAQRSDVALSFEGGGRGEGADQVVVGRRSSSRWDLVVHATTAHSSRIFLPHVGAGAINEAARILTAWYETLRGEENLTFNPGVILGGAEAALTEEARGRAAGKTNIVAERAIVQGDIRTISDEQLERTRERMRAVVAQSLPGTRAEIAFEDGYPAMTPTEGNYALLARYDEISRALGLGPVETYPPAMRGAGDIAFVARYLDSLDGLGPHGDGAHTVDETVNLKTLVPAAQRAAILIHRLTRP